jgi:AcrR family transcriptional regulator
MTDRPGFGDAEAKRIIARAAEIDAEQGRRLDAPALREIAAEAGISPSAVDRALAELESTPPAPVPWFKRPGVSATVFIATAVIVAMLLLFVFGRLIAPAPPPP